MGTRGAFGFKEDGRLLLTYNHWDSYPMGLGMDIVKAINGWNPKDIRKIVRKIVLIDGNTPPTLEQKEHCKPWTDLTIGDETNDSWQFLLRRAQGDILAWLEGGLRLMRDDATFIEDTVMCEFHYIIDLDDMMFRVYSTPDLIKSIPLTSPIDIPETIFDDLLEE